ncbi:MAG: barstar family protein [Lachnospiraceae bacterium]|nr:barstar family protein [Lachnospiraceae bacterium]
MDYIIDAAKMKDRKAAHEYLKKQLHFPEYYGANLDALHDCLGELVGVTIYYLHGDPDTYADKVYRVLNDCRSDGLDVVDVYRDRLPVAEA